MARRGYTLIEVLVAAAVGCAVLAATIQMLTSVRRMSNVGDFSAALAEGSLALEILHRDLSCAVQKPDPAITEVVQVSKDQPAMQFLLAKTDANGALTGTRIVYRREQLASGNFRLLRQEGTSAAIPIPGAFSKVRVETFNGAGGPFIRVTLHVVTRDVAPGSTAGGLDEAVLTSLIRVAGPEMLNSGIVRFKFMDGLKSVELLKGELGF